MQLAQSIHVAGLSLFGPEPIRSLHLSTDSSYAVTALYGLNGAGKTRILRAMRCALSGVSTGERAFAHLRLSTEYLGWSQLLFIDVCDLVDQRLGRVLDHTWLDTLEGADRDLAWSERVDTLRADLRNFARSHDAFADLNRESMGITVEPVGTPGCPAWDVYVSTVVAATSRAAEHLRPLSDPVERAVEPPWTAETIDEIERRLRSQGSVTTEWAALDHQLHNRRSLTTRSDWVPFRIGYLGRLEIQEGRIAVIDASATIDEIESDSRELVAQQSPDTEELPTSQQWELIEALSSDASQYASALFGGDIRLVYRVCEAESRNHGPYLRWFWCSQRDGELPLAEVSSGEKLIAGTAIATALAVNGEYVTAIVFLDEPERSLHPQAIERVASGLGELLDTENSTATWLYSVVVATHAPALIQPELAHVIHVDRGPDGEVQANEMQLVDWSEPKKLANQLGWTTADLLQKIQKWVIVEGRHDVAVIGSIFEEEFGARGWALAPMQGSQQVTSAITSRFLLDYSDASIRIVLDHIEAEHVVRFNEARQHYLNGDPNQALEVLRHMNHGGSTEINQLVKAVIEAVGRRTFHRIEFIGLQKPDILEYLDPADLGLSSEWSDLMARFKQAHPGPMNGGAYKGWLKQQGMKADDATIRAAARRLDDLSDLSKILE